MALVLCLENSEALFKQGSVCFSKSMAVKKGVFVPYIYHFNNSRLVFISSQYLFDIHFFFFFKSEQKGKKNATAGCHDLFLI